MCKFRSFPVASLPYQHPLSVFWMDIAVERIAGSRHGSFIYKSEDNYLFHLYKER
jgi:hypothetical protein